jgi:hypothetical protein
MDQWEVPITGHHHGYITWEQHLGHPRCPLRGF